MKRKQLKQLIQEASALKGSLYENIKQVDLLLTRIEELMKGEDESFKIEN